MDSIIVLIRHMIHIKLKKSKQKRKEKRRKGKRGTKEPGKFF